MKAKIVFIFIILFSLPIFVKANSVSIICDNDVIIGNTVSCSIKGNSNELVTAVSAKIKLGNDINFLSFTPDHVWLGDGSDGNIDLYTDKDIKNDFIIGTLSLNAANSLNGLDSSISIERVFFYDEKGLEQEVPPSKKNIRIAATNNNLSSLSLNNGILNPNFSSDNTIYSTTIDSKEVIITAKAQNNYAKVSGDLGKKTLNYGNNNFKINVISESGNTKTYTINIIRPNSNKDSDKENASTSNSNSKSSNNNLKDITIKGFNINFDKNITNYNINIPYDIDNLDIQVVPEDEKSKVETNGNTNLKIGKNIIKILVTAENQDTKTYQITVDKKDKNYILSNNADIAEIKIKKYKLNFNKNILNYDLKIKNEKKLDLDIKLEDSKASYQISGNNNLKNGSIIKIIVTSEDGKIKAYIINIKTSYQKITTIFKLIIGILLLINIVRILLKLKEVGNKNGKNN